MHKIRVKISSMKYKQKHITGTQKMILPIIEFYKNFQKDAVDRIATPYSIAYDSLVYWRSQILFTIIMTGWILGTIAIIASIGLFIRENAWGLALLDAFSFVLCIILIFSNRIRYEIRSSIALLIFFAIGNMVIFSVGPLSGGSLWLFTFAVLVAALLGLKPALIAVFLNAFSLSVITWLISTGKIGQDFPFFKTYQAMLATGVNFIVLNVIAAVSVAALVKGLVGSHEKERIVTKNLEIEQIHLTKVKKDLEIEIEEHKQADDKIKENEKKFRQLVEDINEVLYSIDNKGIVNYISPAVKGVLGYTPEDITGKAFWALIHPEDQKRLQGKFQEALSGNLSPAEYRLISKSGEYRWVRSSSKPNYENSLISGLKGVFSDITEEKRLQHDLQQARKMESIGTLAGGIAHDFNNILTTIIGNANLALMEVDKNGSLQEEIEEIKKAGERAATLTRQLLAFSRKQIVQPKVFDLNELLSGIKKMLGRLLSEDVEFLTILEPVLWQVEVDPGQMEQVIMNLTVNARDAMPMGGKLTIKTANTNLNENYFREHGIKNQPGPYVMLAVSDTGSGMDKETQEHIFEPFYTTKEQGKGTGLGLSTVYGIVKQNNGFIWVDSEPGQGTNFKIYLPKVKGAEELEEKKQTPVRDLDGSETVLIVEDNDALRNLAQKTLQRHGYRILVAENGEDALRISGEHEGPIQLMLTDVVMPKMSGKETVERLQPLYPHMKVIYISGYTDDSIVHHGVLSPALNFLAKPFTPEGLALKVRAVLDETKDSTQR